MKILIFAIIAAVLYFAFNQRLQTTVYEVKSLKIRNKVRIAVIGDLHCELYGKDQTKIMNALQKIAPDIVVFTGDIFDKQSADKGAETLLKLVGKRFKSYFVTGNHEYKRGINTKISELLKKYGVIHLNGKTETVEVNGNKIAICGVDDYDCDYFLNTNGVFKEQINRIANRNDNGVFSILLCHQPQITVYHKAASVDLVLSGHAHGGQ